MSQPLLVVDVQRGFLNEFTEHIPGRIVHLIERGDYQPLLFTRFINIPDSPYRKLLDWHECEGPPETELAPQIESLAAGGLVFDKCGFTGMPEELKRYLAESTFPSITLVGIDTDMCVLKIAMDVFDLDIEPLVMTDCCASTLGLQAHLAGLAILSRNIGPHQLRDSGLGEGQIAAPERAGA